MHHCQRAYPPRTGRRRSTLLFTLGLLGATIAGAGSLYAFKFNWEKEKELSEVKVWQSIIEQNKNYVIAAADRFEQGMLWDDKSKLSYSTRFKVIANLPEEEAYSLEQKLLADYAGKPAEQSSLSVTTHFNTPGTEFFYMTPRIPVFLNGFIKRVSVWVKSAEYPHSLEFKMRDSLGREQSVRIASLNFRGWRRFDVTLPKQFSTRNRRTTKQYESQLMGIVIRSSRFAKRNHCHIILDNINFLIDRTEWDYPGSEIQDDWGDFIGKKRIR